MPRIIAHLDMDAFFAAIEERDNPRWRGAPLVVGADPKDGRGRGVVSTANYAARHYGIRSAMPISRAWRAAQDAARRGEPETIFLPVDGRRYGNVSRAVMERIAQAAPIVECSSVDEAYLDLSHVRTYRRAESLCRALQRDIKAAQGLTCSIGIGPNKLVAKVASDFKKPAGLTVVRTRDTHSFLAPLEARKLPGIGPKTERLLKTQGLATVGDVQALTEGDLYGLLGEHGLDLYERVRGRDDTPLVVEWTAKSIGEQETLMEDTLESGVLLPCLYAMAVNILRQAAEDGFRACGRIVLTIRFSDFRTVTRSRTRAFTVGASAALCTEATKMFLPFLDKRENPSRLPIRLVGLRLEDLTEKERDAP